jgi:hypothetical protein
LIFFSLLILELDSWRRGFPDGKNMTSVVRLDWWYVNNYFLKTIGAVGLLSIGSI